MKIYDYKYRARKLKDGKIVKGTTEAPNKAMVDKFLQEKGLKPITPNPDISDEDPIIDLWVPFTRDKEKFTKNY